MKYILVGMLAVVMMYLTSCTCNLTAAADIEIDPQLTVKERVE